MRFNRINRMVPPRQFAPVPTVISATIDVTGATLIVVFNVPVIATGTSFLLSLGSLQADYFSGSGTNTATYLPLSASGAGTTFMSSTGSTLVTASGAKLRIAGFPVRNLVP